MKQGPAFDELLTLPALREAYASGRWTAGGVLKETLRRIEESKHSNVWISRARPADIDREVERIEALRHSGKALPLFGVAVALKDNIDVAGMPTTAACREFAYMPSRSAAAVQRLTDAGAIVVGKTNLDQFATGLVGTRSPYGVCRNTFNADYISGGSSSGSAVAVAAGLTPISLGTDTAGSGRVPAGFNNIVGLKPTKGLISARGVVPACKSLDCVSIFALTSEDAHAVLDVLAGFDFEDSYSRDISMEPAAAKPAFRFGRPSDGLLKFFGNAAYESGYRRAIELFRQLGGEEVIIDYAPFEQTARLLYEGPWVAERTAGIAEFWKSHPDAILPVTRQILSGAARFDAQSTFAAMHRLMDLQRSAGAQWKAMDLLLLPTAGTIYTVDEVQADPIATNTNLGYYTNFVNLLDLCGLALPAGFTPSGLPFGVTILASAGKEQFLAAIGRRIENLLNLPAGAIEKRRPTPKE